jgi:uncharacterized protein (TIGR01619 family)
MREFFVRANENELVNIEIDMSAYGYSSDNPWLFSIFIKFNAQDEQIAGYEEFLETKESIIIALEHEKKAVFVGSRIVDGWSELYFYAKESKDLESIVTSMLKNANYVYECSVVKDTKWDFHYKNLAPTELELCHIESEKIIFMLEEEEDDLSIVRPVEHYISFELPTQKNRFLNTLALEGYTLKDEISNEEFENGVALVKEHAVSSEIVKEEVTKLFEEIKKSQGHYEGWSTVLASELEE